MRQADNELQILERPGCSSSKCAAVMCCQGSFQSRYTDGQGRKENYLIRMLNKGGLAFPISTWIPGAVRRHLVLPKTPERILNWCILESMFNRGWMPSCSA